MATNTGYQSGKILEGFFTDDESLTGFIMPNITFISNEAIVPDTATITFNTNSDPSPSGGADGDVWYNLPSDILYKKVGGIWSLITDRVPNSYYQAPVQNLTDCPI